MAFVLHFSVCTSPVELSRLLSRKETTNPSTESRNSSGHSDVLLVSPLFFSER